ncbi:MlaD family protein [Nocardia spumae]|uniref:MlaD family protein n=1 Tax=Nocardia spumae TaxID=2887190 RepID=UPI001D1494D5|nr:MlaD family protein [Nocardia spumae]
MKLKSVASLAGIAMITLLGVGYLAFGVVRVDPLRRDIPVTLVVPNSTGIEVNSPVLLTGVRVGKVTDIRRGRGQVELSLALDSRTPVLADSAVTVESLSALGEPYIEFAPNVDRGPVLHAGQVLEGHQVHAPMSIAQVSHLVTQVMNQLDPRAMSALVDAADTALSGTDAAVPSLARAGDLIAAMLLSRSPEIGRILDNLQATAADMEWAAPSFQAASPKFSEFALRVNQIAEAVEGLARVGDTPSMYQQGNGLVPFLAKLTAWIDKAGPDLKELAPAIQPLAETATTAIPTIDLSQLIGRAAQASSPAGAVHLRVDVK